MLNKIKKKRTQLLYIIFFIKLMLEEEKEDRRRNNIKRVVWRRLRWQKRRGRDKEIIEAGE